MKKVFATAAFIASLIAVPASAYGMCELHASASLDMSTDVAGGVYIPMSIGGHTVNMLIDTGGAVSMLNENSVKSLNLSPNYINGMWFELFGGLKLHYYALAHDVNLGHLRAASLRFLVVPDGHFAEEEGGTLAPEILAAYDVDFDFANAKFNLISQDHCLGKVIYWTKDPYAQIPFRLDSAGHIHLPVKVDGQLIMADIDTGSSRSILSLESAEDLFHFDAKSSDLKPDAIEGNEHFFKYRFKTLALQGVSVSNPDIMLISDSESHIPGYTNLILGMGVLRQLHLYIAYREHTVYATAASAH